MMAVRMLTQLTLGPVAVVVVSVAVVVDHLLWEALKALQRQSDKRPLALVWFLIKYF